MLVLLSCAKTMSETSKVKVPLTTVPRFQKEASEIALQMSQFSVDELERLLRINARMAVENYKRYQAFHAEDTSELPALLAYTGIVFKRLNAKDFSKEEFEYAQEHLRLTSFCYGLLRPLDVIRSYRLEGDVVLPEPGNQRTVCRWLLPFERHPLSQTTPTIRFRCGAGSCRHNIGDRAYRCRAPLPEP